MGNLEKSLIQRGLDALGDKILEDYSSIRMGDEFYLQSRHEIKERVKRNFLEYVKLSQIIGERPSRIITERYRRIMGYRNGKPNNMLAFE